MPVRIRLSRRGRRKRPFYHIVAADSRAARGGRNIEKIGSYDPTTMPEQVQLDFDKALYWLEKGAQPSDTCKSILSREGVLLKKHLLRGVRKNAITEEEANNKFNEWLKQSREKANAVKEQ
ncbi:MAG: 30S ribosomal protein S16 [Bacteroidota bacterium]